MTELAVPVSRHVERQVKRVLNDGEAEFFLCDWQVPILQVVGALQAGNDLNGAMEEWSSTLRQSPGQGGRLLLGHVDGHQ